MKKLFAVILVFALTLTVVPMSLAFEHSEHVDSLAAELKMMGILEGYPDGTFGLNEELTRAEALAILLRAMDVYEEALTAEYSGTFVDVPTDHWAAPLIQYAYDTSITKGTSETTFAPDTRINAAQFLTMLLRHYLGNAEIAPDTVYGFVVTQTHLSAEYILNLIDADVFYRSDMVLIVYTLYSGIGNFGVALTNEYTNIVQVGEYFHILSVDPLHPDYISEAIVSEENLVSYNGTVILDTDNEDEELPITGAPTLKAHMFQAAAMGRVTVTILRPYAEDKEPIEYELVILEEGKGEGVVELVEEENNTMLIGGLASVILESNPSTGYRWGMIKNDSIEVIQDIYIPIETEEGVVGSGGVQQLTFTASRLGTFEVTLAYTRSWEENEAPAETKTFTITVAESFGE